MRALARDAIVSKNRFMSGYLALLTMFQSVLMWVL
jgi:hypothetical protein